MSDLQGRRIPGEEGSRRRRPILWIVLALIALLLLDLLIPFAREAFAGDGGGGFSGIPLMTFAVVGGALIVCALAARLLWLWVGLLRLRRRGE